MSDNDDDDNVYPKYVVSQEEYDELHRLYEDLIETSKRYMEMVQHNYDMVCAYEVGVKRGVREEILKKGWDHVQANFKKIFRQRPIVNGKHRSLHMKLDMAMAMSDKIIVPIPNGDSLQ
jgi:hypothetical protein